MSKKFFLRFFGVCCLGLLFFCKPKLKPDSDVKIAHLGTMPQMFQGKPGGLPGVVCLLIKGKKDGLFLGSAVKVAPYRYMTAAHVADHLTSDSLLTLINDDDIINLQKAVENSHPGYRRVHVQKSKPAVLASADGKQQYDIDVAYFDLQELTPEVQTAVVDPSMDFKQSKLLLSGCGLVDVNNVRNLAGGDEAAIARFKERKNKLDEVTKKINAIVGRYNNKTSISKADLHLLKALTFERVSLTDGENQHRVSSDVVLAPQGTVCRRLGAEAVIKDPMNFYPPIAVPFLNQFLKSDKPEQVFPGIAPGDSGGGVFAQTSQGLMLVGILSNNCPSDEGSDWQLANFISFQLLKPWLDQIKSGDNGETVPHFSVEISEQLLGVKSKIDGYKK